MINRVGGPALLGAVLVLSVYLAWPRSPASGQAETLPSPKAPAGLKYFGVATCSSMACHHFNGPNGTTRSEYSTWAAADKHAQAYAVLENERSQRIAKNLCGDKAKATKMKLCLKCHATYEEGMVKGDRFYKGDGVGCEACHGPADKYLTTHYLAGFKEKTPEQKEREFGLRNTKDLVKRTKLCTTCHVGDGSKEVNHDLIAAGHPRLNFEMGGYHGIYAKHWPHANDLARNKDFEARLWLIGQFSTAKAAIDLLEVRARESLKDTKDAKPWPEFAEYACFACHKDVKVDSPSQRSDYYTKRHPGSFPYGTWYLSMVPEVAGQVTRDAAPLTRGIDKLRGLMEQPGPDAAKVAKQAKEVSAVLDGMARRVAAGRDLDEAQLRGYLDKFVRDGAKRANSMNWDQAAQLYLSMGALHQALFDLQDPLATSGKLKPDLMAIKNRLRGAFPLGFDSPRRFDPLKAPSLKSQLESIGGHLGK